VRLRSIIKVLLFPNWAVNERIRLTHLLNATNGKLVDAENHIRELTEARIGLQDELAVMTAERDRFRDILAALDTAHFVTPGHFYSPMPSKLDVEQQLTRQLEQGLLLKLPAVDLNIQGQLKLLDLLKNYYPRVPFGPEPVQELLYHLDNPYYSYTDGILLFCMLNHLRPKRIIEIGSGFSTCAILDTNRLCLGGKTQVTCIDPHPQNLRSLLAKSQDPLTIIESKVQDTDIMLFDQLDRGDFLFIDSSHVCKAGSDVNRILFEILPNLNSGVVIHIHDICIGFEYPDTWLREGRAWNEAYLLRAFLEYNDQFRILLFISYLQNMHRDWFHEHMPDTLKKQGACFWMEKL